MKNNLSFVEQFNRSDNLSNAETIALLDNLSPKQRKTLINMVNAQNKEIFKELRKKGEIK